MNGIIKYPRRLKNICLLASVIVFLCISGGIVTISVPPKFALLVGTFILLFLLIPPLLEKVHIFLLAFIALIPFVMVVPLIEDKLSITPLLGIFVFGLCSVNLCTKKDSLRIIPEFKWLFALAAVMFIASWAGTNVGHSLYVSKTYAQLFLLFFLVTQVLKEPKQLFLTGWILIGSLSLVAFLLALDNLRFINIQGGFESVNYQEIHARAGALGRDANESALYFSLAIPFTLYYIMIYRDVIKRTLLITCLIVLISAVILTYSMGGAIGLISVFVFFVLLHKNIGIGKKVILFMSLVPILFGMYILSPPSFKLRVQHQYNVINNEDFSKWGTGRGATWLGALNTIKENPIIGVGPGNAGYEIGPRLAFYRSKKRKYKVAHNTLLGVAAETGVVGVCLFVTLIGSILKKLSTKLKISPPIVDRNFSYLGSAIYVGLASFLVQSMFLDMQRSKYLWLLLGLAVSFRSIVTWSCLDHKSCQRVTSTERK